MKLKFAVSVLAFWVGATGCGTTPHFNPTVLSADDCAAVERWIKAPPRQGLNSRIVSFDWNYPEHDAETGEAIVPMRAMMTGNSDLDEHDFNLYREISYRTHYVLLSELAQSIAQCFNAKFRLQKGSEWYPKAFDSQFEVAGRRVNLRWRPVYCGTEIFDDNGCLRIEVRYT